MKQLTRSVVTKRWLLFVGPHKRWGTALARSNNSKWPKPENGSVQPRQNVLIHLFIMCFHIGFPLDTLPLSCSRDKTFQYMACRPERRKGSPCNYNFFFLFWLLFWIISDSHQSWFVLTLALYFFFFNFDVENTFCLHNCHCRGRLIGCRNC